MDIKSKMNLDLVSGIIKLIFSESKLLRPVNLGNPVEMKIIQIAKKLIKLIKSKSNIIYQSLSIDDPVEKNPDITLAKNKLSWIPKTPLEIGLLKTTEFLKL